jgi:uncharacterized protein involved in outer membrane biogenesis
MLKKISKFFAWVFGSIFVLLIALAVLAKVYKQEIIAKVVEQLNPYLNAEVRLQPNDIDFSIFSAFPKAAVQFKNVTIFEPNYIQNRDTLCYAKLIQFEFNWNNLLNKKYDIDKISLEEGQLNLRLLKDGNNNWDILKKDSAKTNSNSNVKFAINLISAKNLMLLYKDEDKNFSLNNSLNKLLLSGNFYNTDFEINTDINGSIISWQINQKRLFEQKVLLVKTKIQKTDNKYFYQWSFRDWKNGIRSKWRSHAF